MSWLIAKFGKPRLVKAPDGNWACCVGDWLHTAGWDFEKNPIGVGRSPLVAFKNWAYSVAGVRTLSFALRDKEC